MIRTSPQTGRTAGTCHHMTQLRATPIRRSNNSQSMQPSKQVDATRWTLPFVLRRLSIPTVPASFTREVIHVQESAPLRISHRLLADCVPASGSAAPPKNNPPCRGGSTRRFSSYPPAGTNRKGENPRRQPLTRKHRLQ